DHSFSGCTGLTSLTIPGGVTSIGDYAFYSCTGLTSVTIPESVTSIGDYSFERCTGLINVTIPGSVTSIGNVAFNGCTGLTSVTIPGSVTSIGQYAFSSCENLQNVIFKGNAPSVGRDIFSFAAPNFTVMTFPGSSGFSFPDWEGYPSIILSPIQQWRITHFQTPGNTGAAADSGDPDGDGSVNLDEFTAGTLPTDAADVLRIASAARSGAAFTVTLPGRTGRSYQLLRGSDPAAASWESIVTQGPAVAESPVTLTDPQAPAGRAFYRVAVSGP
ncbi:MAG: leucine-rich repeat domain-containing protein, partial [Verrucomicrobiaceae bacterium]